MYWSIIKTLIISGILVFVGKLIYEIGKDQGYRNCEYDMKNEKEKNEKEKDDEEKSV